MGFYGIAQPGILPQNIPIPKGCDPRVQSSNSREFQGFREGKGAWKSPGIFLRGWDMGGDLPFGIPKGPGSAMATPGYHKIPPFQGLRGSCIRKNPLFLLPEIPGHSQILHSLSQDSPKSLIPVSRAFPSLPFPGGSRTFPNPQSPFPAHSKSPIPIPSTFPIPSSRFHGTGAPFPPSLPRPVAFRDSGIQG